MDNLAGFEVMEEEVADNRLTKNSIMWTRVLKAFLASGVKRMKKEYPTDSECSKAYRSAYYLAYRHYTRSIKVIKRGTTLILEREDAR